MCFLHDFRFPLGRNIQLTLTWLCLCSSTNPQLFTPEDIVRYFWVLKRFYLVKLKSFTHLNYGYFYCLVINIGYCSVGQCQGILIELHFRASHVSTKVPVHWQKLVLSITVGYINSYWFNIVVGNCIPFQQTTKGSTIILLFPFKVSKTRFYNGANIAAIECRFVSRWRKATVLIIM